MYISLQDLESKSPYSSTFSNALPFPQLPRYNNSDISKKDSTPALRPFVTSPCYFISIPWALTRSILLSSLSTVPLLPFPFVLTPLLSPTLHYCLPLHNHFLSSSLTSPSSPVSLLHVLLPYLTLFPYSFIVSLTSSSSLPSPLYDLPQLHPVPLLHYCPLLPSPRPSPSITCHAG